MILSRTAIYEDESDNDLSMESHGSVVTHLLSQVKIGMDLTKVVLPTFILERRSLLEMYADYFAHPDLFVRIADFKDPRDRMVQVVRWYLSAYHAGRKSSVAKKPYNPIIGEVFRCHWNIPEFGRFHKALTRAAADIFICRKQRERDGQYHQRRACAVVQKRSADFRFGASVSPSPKYEHRTISNFSMLNAFVLQYLPSTPSIMESESAFPLTSGRSRNFWDCRLAFTISDKASLLYVI